MKNEDDSLGKEIISKFIPEIIKSNIVPVKFNLVVITLQVWFLKLNLQSIASWFVHTGTLR